MPGPRSLARLLPVAAVLPWLAAAPVEPAALAVELAGKVVAIADGDTLTLLTADKRQVKLRLGEVDAPEDGQPYGAKAKQVLSDLAFAKEVRGVVTDIDRYGRPVVRLHVGEVDVSADLVRRGAAMVYPAYSSDPALPVLEAEARAARRGLWALPEKERVPPWEWREARREAAAARKAPPPPRVGPSAAPAASRPAAQASACGAKRTCGQMSSCDEARFHLTQCGLTKLDGDGDGVPCNKLCRR